MTELNPLTLAAENNSKLLTLLHSDPSLASVQDNHGYSLLHAAVSYNHLELLTSLVKDFDVNVNIKDEDGETPLFVVETVEAAQILIVDLGADVTVVNTEGETAEEKILSEGEHPTIVAFLKESRIQNSPNPLDVQAGYTLSACDGPFTDVLHHPPPLPPNVTVNLGTMEEVQPIQTSTEADPDFGRRIEELAARDDFKGEQGQEDLKELVKDAVRCVGTQGNERDVRRRLQ